MNKNYHNICSSINKNSHSSNVSLYGISSTTTSDFEDNNIVFKDYILFKSFDYYRLSDLEGLDLSDLLAKSVSEFGRKWLDY